MLDNIKILWYTNIGLKIFHFAFEVAHVKNVFPYILLNNNHTVVSK